MAVLWCCAVMPVRAEISADIIRVMEQSDEVMTNPDGIRMDMSVHASMLVLSIHMKIQMLDKGDKSKATITSSVLGKEIKSEEGCDGVQAWEYKKGVLRDERDTLILSACEKSDYAVDLSIHDDYNNAKMSLKKGVYEITLTNPKGNDTPKKTVFRINAENYHPMEMVVKESGMTMTMKIDQITFGVPDEAFAFRMEDFPDAVVVNKVER